MIKKEIKKLKNEMPCMDDRSKNLVMDMLEKELGYRPLYRQETHTFNSKRVAVIAIAAGITAGSAIAATGLSRLNAEKKGNYGVETCLDNSDNPVPDSDEVCDVKLSWNYIPAGLKVSDDETGLSPDGIINKVSALTVLADGDMSGKVLDLHVEKSEEMNVNGKEAIFIKRVAKADGKSSFDKVMYIFYPDVERIVALYGDDSLEEEEFIKVAENLELSTTGNMLERSEVFSWSQLAEMMQPIEDGTFLQTGVVEVYSSDEAFYPVFETDKVSMKVSDVKVYDKVPVDSDLLNEWKDIIDSDGNILPDTRKYIKSGDGVLEIDRVIKQETVARKLVYITLDVKNEDRVDYSNLRYKLNLGFLEDTADGMKGRFSPKEGDEWDVVSHMEYLDNSIYMMYCRTEGENNVKGSSGLIRELKAGESKTITLAWLVDEDALGYMYLTNSEFVTTYGGICVDIRQ